SEALEARAQSPTRMGSDPGSPEGGVSVDREGLRRWYLAAMARRIDQLREVRAGVTLGEQDACDAARAVAQALRGSGGTFGFPSLSTAAALAESAPNGSLLRRVEGLIEH